MKSKILLAYLCLNFNRHVSIDSVIEAVWGEESPASARKNAQLYVSRFRKLARGATDMQLATTGDGYRLSIDPEQVDLERSERLRFLGKESVRSGAHGKAVQLFREAIQLWRGEPLSGLAQTPMMKSEEARLKQIRLGLWLEYFSAQLTRGQYSEIIPELIAVVASNPHQERLRADLMLALWRTGERHAALEVYRDVYQVLADEFGISPGRRLQMLHQALLTDDAAAVEDAYDPLDSTLEHSGTLAGYPGGR
ncbi:BTAD domain-containing putative transcriptional regulator [Streptomyces sp. NPDC053253]|uniref:AfsR/SARP family transcriptional regulator n=1 Tax=Streptomyces sp. NPDC053253 TaxID=3365699 RepID=UPI0037D0AA74